jgi:hypothetical protein
MKSLPHEFTQPSFQRALDARVIGIARESYPWNVEHAEIGPHGTWPGQTKVVIERFSMKPVWPADDMDSV